MTDTDRYFLLSLLVAVGCGDDPPTPQTETEGTSDPTEPTTTAPPTTSNSASSTATDGTTDGSESSSGFGSDSTTLPEPTTTDTTSTTDDTTSEGSSSSGTTGTLECADKDAGPFVVACCSLLGLYGECSGYEIPPYCEEYAAYYYELYGQACVDALTEIWSCLSMLDCGAFGDEFPAECTEVALSSHMVCPELIALCTSGSGGVGKGFCEVEALGCLDGHTYGVECMGAVCTCMLDDVAVGSFPGTPDSCFEDDFGEVATESCGFPSGVF